MCCTSRFGQGVISEEDKAKQAVGGVQLASKILVGRRFVNNVQREKGSRSLLNIASFRKYLLNLPRSPSCKSDHLGSLRRGACTRLLCEAIEEIVFLNFRFPKIAAYFQTSKRCDNHSSPSCGPASVYYPN